MKRVKARVASNQPELTVRLGNPGAAVKRDKSEPSGISRDELERLIAESHRLRRKLVAADDQAQKAVAQSLCDRSELESLRNRFQYVGDRLHCACDWYAILDAVERLKGQAERTGNIYQSYLAMHDQQSQIANHFRLHYAGEIGRGEHDGLSLSQAVIRYLGRERARRGLLARIRGWIFSRRRSKAQTPYLAPSLPPEPGIYERIKWPDPAPVDFDKLTKELKHETKPAD